MPSKAILYYRKPGRQMDKSTKEYGEIHPFTIQFLNQARAGKGRHAHGFLKLNLCRSSVCECVCVCLCVCPPPRLLITSGKMWRDIDPIRLVKQVL